MAKFDDGQDGVTSFDEVLYNDIVRAIKNAIVDSGQPIDATNIQLSKALANYASVSTFYTENGVANAYNLIPIDNFKGLAALIEGAEVRFRTANPNTGASTVNVNLLGAVNITKADGVTSLDAGDISADQDNRIRYDGSVWRLQSVIVAAATESLTGTTLLPKQITISNNVIDPDHDIDFTAGNFIFDDGSGQAVASALTKQIDANWVAGDNVGGLDTGTVAADTTYHCFAIHNVDTQISDFLFSTSISSPILPAGYTKKRRVGSLVTDGAANIINFVQVGNRFYLKTPIQDFNAAPPTQSTGLTDVIISAPNNVIAILHFQYEAGGGSTAGRTVLAKDKVSDATFPVIRSRDTQATSGETQSDVEIDINTDANNTIQVVASADTGLGTLIIITKGWIDNNL